MHEAKNIVWTNRNELPSQLACLQTFPFFFLNFFKFINQIQILTKEQIRLKPSANPPLSTDKSLDQLPIETL